MTEVDNIEDPEQKEFEFKMSKLIQGMPVEVRDRFKALKVFMDQVNALDEEEDKAYRELEVKYDKLYQDIYEQRRKIIQGTELTSQQNLLAEYEKREKELDDDDYKKIEVAPCDVKEIQNTKSGVYGFWLRAMLNHGGISRIIQEKDRPILMHLQDVSCVLHEVGYGFDLVFSFEKNDYFTNESLKKTFTMSKQNIIEKCEGSEILWKEGRDVTKKKIKKKSKNKKGNKTVTKTVEQESFFNFFKTLSMPDEKELEEGDEEEKNLGEKMDQDFDLGNDFKDQLIPLALEYYMEVIEEEDPEIDSDEEDEKPKKDKKESDDSEDDKPAKGKKKGKKGGEQQECKQQ